MPELVPEFLRYLELHLVHHLHVTAFVRQLMDQTHLMEHVFLRQEILETRKTINYIDMFAKVLYLNFASLFTVNRNTSNAKPLLNFKTLRFQESYQDNTNSAKSHGKLLRMDLNYTLVHPIDPQVAIQTSN